MTERDDFITLVSASLTGILANGVSTADPVKLATRHAVDALVEINQRYPKANDRHTHIEREQQEFAKRIEQEHATNGKNGSGR